MRILLAVMMLLCLTAPVAAQSGNAACSVSGYADLLSHILDNLSEPDADLDFQLEMLIVLVQTKRAICAGFAFEGESNTIVGPFDLPAGDYIVEATFQNMGTAAISTLTNDCESDFLFLLLRGPTSDGGVDNTLLRTDQECRVVVEMSARLPWTLIFTPVG